MKVQIKAKAEETFERVQAYRRHLHMHPELSFQEHETARWVSEIVQSLHLKVSTGIAGTGVVAEIEGKNPTTRTVALRADMDALPITEQNKVPYASLKPGVMHACGHDVHTASLLGAAHILSELSDSFEGTVRLVFQPGEERLPGGASRMIRDGVLQNPVPTAMIGQHVMPQLQAGKVGFRAGRYMASTDELYITITGKGGHAATPELCVDPVSISAQIIVALQQIVSRIASPKTPSVLSFGKVLAQGATNVIPNEVYIEGTFRTMDETWREIAHKRMVEIATAIATSMGAECQFEVRRGYPVLDNHPILTRHLKNAAMEYMGEALVTDLDLWMAAEDFAYYTHHVPSCFYRLGTRNEAKGIVSGVHTPTFDIDESALAVGSGLMAWLAISALTNP
jgi:amidohydrolase